jgi:hypothetical protein
MTVTPQWGNDVLSTPFCKGYISIYISRPCRCIFRPLLHKPHDHTLSAYPAPPLPDTPLPPAGKTITPDKTGTQYPTVDLTPNASQPPFYGILVNQLITKSYEIYATNNTDLTDPPPTTTQRIATAHTCAPMGPRHTLSSQPTLPSPGVCRNMLIKTANTKAEQQCEDARKVQRNMPHGHRYMGLNNAWPPNHTLVRWESHSALENKSGRFRPTGNHRETKPDIRKGRARKDHPLAPLHPSPTNTQSIRIHSKHTPKTTTTHPLTLSERIYQHS